jgi:hypothetical protein
MVRHVELPFTEIFVIASLIYRGKHRFYVCADLDTFVMDNSGTKKEKVSRSVRG